jgi:hypothetical protein
MVDVAGYPGSACQVRRNPNITPDLTNFGGLSPLSLQAARIERLNLNPPK